MNSTWIVLTVGVALLASRRLRPDFVVVGTVLALQLSGALSLQQALAGFSNPAVVTVAAFMMLSNAARGVDWHRLWEAWLQRRGNSIGSLSFWTMWAGGLLAGIIHEEQAVGMLMPGTIRAGRQQGIPPSKLVLPLAYGALLGRTLFLVGSPAALLVIWAMNTAEIKPFGLFDFTFISMLFLMLGSLFMALVGHTVLPWRRAESDPLDRFRVRRRLMEFVVRPDSPVIGKSLGDIRWGQSMDVIVLGLKRTHEPILAPAAQLQLAHGDVLIAQVEPSCIAPLSRDAGLEPVPNVTLGTEDITHGDIELVEVVVRLDSPLQRQSLRQVDFRRRYNLSVLAIARGSRVLVDALGDIPLQAGDVLLLQGDRRRVDLMLPEAKAIPLGERAVPRRTRERSSWTVGGVVVALGLAGSGLLPLLSAFLLAALLMAALTRYSTRDAYRVLDWPLLVLLAGVVPWAEAMRSSHLSERLVEALLGGWASPNPYAVLFVVYLIVVALVTVMNAPVVAVLLPPVVLGIATQLGVNPQPFLMTLVLASSAVFLWPVGHRTHILVQSTGGYVAGDYAKLGIWLVLLMGLLNVLIVPQLWPF